MTRFDEPIRNATTIPSPLRAAIRVAGDRPLIAVALVSLTSSAIVVAMALLLAQALVTDVLNRTFAAGPIVVFAVPGSARAATDALGARLKALPVVADAVFRPREDALAALIQAGMPQSRDNRNPLPDAWTLVLRPDAGEHESFVTTATALRDTLAALPGVDQVRFDARWNERLEQWSDHWKRYGRPLVVVGLLASALGVAAFWFLARDAVLKCCGGATPYQRTLTCYAGLGAIAAGLTAGVAVSLLRSLIGRIAGDWPMPPIAVELGNELGIVAVLTAIAAVLAILATRSYRVDSL